MSDSTLLASLMATTQVPTPAAPAAPTAPVVPPAPAAPVVQYYVVDNGVTKQVPAAALTAAIAAGYTGPVMRVGDSEWGTAATYGLASAPVVPPAPPAPPAAPSGLIVQAVPTPAPLAVTVAAPVTSASANLPSLVTSAEEADQVFNLMLASQTSSSSAVDVLDELDQGGMSHVHPFATLKKGTWKVAKQIDQHIANYMPVGERAWTGIYLGHRVGAVGWGSEGSAATGGEKPVYQFVLPTLTSGVAPDLKDLFRETLRVARGIQFTKKEQRSKFDALGRMAVETQILCWHNEIGYAILVVPGYSPTDATCRALAETEKAGGITKPVTFSVVAEKQENKKVMKVDPKADNASWDIFSLKGQLDASVTGGTLFNSFMENMIRDKIGFANVVKSFMTGADFNGLPLHAVRELLPKYSPLLAR